jgi:hypothetical protein
MLLLIILSCRLRVDHESCRIDHITIKCHLRLNVWLEIVLRELVCLLVSADVRILEQLTVIEKLDDLLAVDLTHHFLLLLLLVDSLVKAIDLAMNCFSRLSIALVQNW